MTSILSIDIRTPNDIDILAAYLHDAVFRADEVKLLPSQHEVTMRFWRETTEIASRSLFPLLPFVYTRRFRRAECVLSWRNVRQFVCRERDPLDYHCVTSVRADLADGVQKIEFVTEGALDLQLVVGELDAECRDTGKVTENQFGFKTLTLRRFPRAKSRGREKGQIT